MRVITINLGEAEIDFLESFKENGIFPSRSEIIRYLIRIGIPYLREQFDFQKRVIYKKLIPAFRETTPEAVRNNVVRRVVPLQKQDVNRFNKCQDIFYIICNGKDSNEYKIVKRI